MKLSKELKKVILKLLKPSQLYQIFKLQKDRKRLKRARKDAQLKLYSEILTGDYLHYGYFENPDTVPEDISLNDMERAQHDYACQFLKKISDRNSPILDVGCGMGGLSNMLLKEKLKPIALTPDLNQIRYIGKKYPGIELVHGKFEEIDSEKYVNHFGTIITSESLQYLKLDKALALIDKILKKGGAWLVCDYFRKGESFEKSGHFWDSFLEKISENRFSIIHEKDITKNILVTLKYVYMWANRLGLPIMNFTFEKFRTKQPGFHYLFKDAVNNLEKSVNDGIEVINPERFEKEKKYMFLVIKRGEK